MRSISSNESFKYVPPFRLSTIRAKILQLDSNFILRRIAINPEANHIELIIKLGAYEHMRSLFDGGTIYMNTLEFYRTLEAHDERRDINEGAERVRNWRGGVLKRRNRETGAYEEVAQLTHSTIRELNSNLQNLNVYCLYYFKDSIPIESLGGVIPQRTKLGFGDFAVVVTDVGEFVTRIKQAAIEKGYKHFRSLVEYTDFSQDYVEAGPFVKDEAFAHHSELRIAVHTGRSDGSAIRLEIGSLKGIAVMVPSGVLDEISIFDEGR